MNEILAENPKWINESHTAIDLLVIHPLYGEINFTATNYDVEEIGREIFSRAVNGEFGAIAEYEAK